MAPFNNDYLEFFRRQPDWRYRLAVEYASCRRTVRPLECELVDQCVALIRQSAQCPSKARGRALDRRQTVGPLHYAYLLYGNSVHAELKLEVEARILAGQSDAQIADATGLSEAICSTYEQVFFNIRDRLDGIDYIMCDVIGCTLIDSDDPQTLARQSLYKLAYCLGSHALEIILAVRRLVATHSADQYRHLVQQQVLANPKLRRLLTAERLQPFGVAAKELLSDLLGIAIEQPSAEQPTSAVPPEGTSFDQGLRSAG